MKEELEKQVSENSSSIKLLTKDISYMRSGIDEIKNSINSLKIDINNGFATKEELNSLKGKIKDLEDLKGWAIKIVVGGIIVSLLAIIGIK